MESLPWLIAIAAAYVCGSIPFALLIGLTRGVDIRQRGSGNIGATNLSREVSRAAGLLCFALDVLKGALPVLGAGAWFGLLGGDVPGAGTLGLWMLTGVAAVVGHVAPVWLGFRGGKGVATGFGAVLGLWPYLTLPALGAGLVWLLAAGVWRYVSLASVLAALSLPVLIALAAPAGGWTLADTWPLVAVAAGMALLIVARHRTNLRRIRAGTEGRIGE